MTDPTSTTATPTHAERTAGKVRVHFDDGTTRSAGGNRAARATCAVVSLDYQGTWRLELRADPTEGERMADRYRNATPIRSRGMTFQVHARQAWCLTIEADR